MAIDSQLSQKLSHALVEIRERALESILFKFSTGILSAGDLAREKWILKSLLDLLHDSDEAIAAKHVAILKLLDTISELPSAQDRLIELGALRGLKQLHINQDLQEKILKKMYHSGGSRSRAEFHSRTSSPRRLPSPTRRTSSPIRKTYSVPQTDLSAFDVPLYHAPPHIPTTIKGYDYIHLSPVDSKTVDNLTRSLASANPDIEVQSKLFDVICIDFGAQVFLQQSNMLSLLVEGLVSSNEQQFVQTLTYLKKLLEGLTVSFRQFCDLSSASGTFSPDNISPNVSVNVPLSAMDRGAGAEEGLSLPTAAHTIFVHLTEVIRFDTHFPRILSLLNDLVPFLLLYVQELISTLVDSPSEVEDVILYYMSRTLIATRRQIGVSDEKAAVFNDLLSWFALESLSYLLELLPKDLQTRVLPKALDLFMYQSQPCDFVDFVAYSLLQDKSTTVRKWLAPLLSGRSEWGLKLVESCLDYSIKSGSYETSKCIIYQLTKCEKSVVFPQLQSKVADAICTLSKNNAFSQGTDLDFFNVVGQICGSPDTSSVDNDQTILFSLRGLLSRNEYYRRLAFAKLQELLPFDLSNYPDEPSEIFVFSAAVLNSVKNEDSVPRLASLELNHGWGSLNEELVENKSLASKNLPDIWDKLRMPNRSVTDENLLYLLGAMKELFVQWTSSHQDISHASCGFKVVRLLCENYPFIRSQVGQDTSFLVALFKVALATTPLNRLECSRIIAAAVLSCVEQYQPTKADSYNITPNLLLVPNLIAQSFLIYGPINKLNIEPSFRSLSEPELVQVQKLLSNYLSIAATKRETTARSFLANSVEALSAAKSHHDFMDALYELQECLGSTVPSRIICSMDFQKPLERFFLVLPVSQEDQMLLSDILKFLRELSVATRERDKIVACCISGLQKVLLPCLQKSIVEEDAQHSNQALATLPAEIMSFLRWAISSFTDDELQRVVNSTPCLTIIKEYTHHTFASEYGSAKNHRERINCLACLLSFTSLPSLVSAVRAETIVDLIHLLVQILGYSQQNYNNATHGNAFTYKDRNVYRWVVTCLRNLSRTVVMDGDAHVPWTDHWLFNGSLDWLLTLLNDDEKFIQKLGLGILGNLILIKGSYPHICLKIPQFLDMAFSLFLDFDHQQSRRAEAIQIINNFIVPFCRGSSEYAGLSFFEQSDIDPKAEIIKICESSGLFDRFRDLLDCPPHNMSYRLALSELLLNLVLIAPDVMLEKFMDLDVVESLLGWVSISVEIVGAHSSNDAFNRFRRSQFQGMYSQIVLSSSKNALHFLRILLSKTGYFAEILLQSSSFLSMMQGLFNDISVFIEHSFTDHVKSSALYWNCFKHASYLFGNMLQNLSTVIPNDMAAVFYNQSSGHHLLKLLCFALHNTDDFECRRASAYLLTRILVIHYGEILKLDLERLLSQDAPYSLLTHSGKASLSSVSSPAVPKTSIAVFLTESFIQMLTEEYDSEDAIFIESVRISLQCLLGRNEHGQALAISVSFHKQLIDKALGILRPTSKKIDEAKQSDLFIIMSLLRHLMAGSREAKIQCGQFGLPNVILEIIVTKDILPPLMLETLECLRNMIANCDDSKKRVLETRSGRDGTSILDTLIDFLIDIKSMDETFFASLEVMKMLVLYSECRVQMIKMNFADQLATLMSTLMRLRHSARVDGILQLLDQLTYSPDGQLHVIRVCGFLGLISECLLAKSLNTRRLAALVLRNLAILRENKARFLALDDFFSTLESALQCKSLKVLAPMCSMTFVLLYDSEKVKATAKKTSLKDAMSSLEGQLRQEYVHFLLPVPPKGEEGFQDIDREDEELLRQILRDLSVMNKLLR